MFFKKLWSDKNCKHNTYKLEADFSVDSIWCNECGENLDIEDFSLSNSLQEELEYWVSDYGKWIDFGTDSLREKGIEMENDHNKRGLGLLKKIKEELGRDYPIIFSSCKSGKLYQAEKEK
ncbi:hypothetical protein [Priestia megaterium]|uniref:hypothetical protein n=1 Tax=Priestia megaterium TaxID=1404 RepID=UPI00244C2D25|nr:hypothetical protein [Priestia megaterium]MDH2363646.1 hypothetical protein [Priestia megaterium]